ncbi:MAG TPA: DUF1330 domain-containing protein [Azospirillaceae bacterium]|nr:DUF1330 domain-containing protein [Azospirillaceae bacterium]
MAVYIVAQLRFRDEERYRRYQAGFGAVFARSGGRLLAADESPRVMEGDWPWQKVVMMEFADAPAAERFMADPDYVAIAEDRKAGAETVALLVHGWGAQGAPRGVGAA